MSQSGNYFLLGVEGLLPGLPTSRFATATAAGMSPTNSSWVASPWPKS